MDAKAFIYQRTATQLTPFYVYMHLQCDLTQLVRAAFLSSIKSITMTESVLLHHSEESSPDGIPRIRRTLLQTDMKQHYLCQLFFGQMSRKGLKWTKSKIHVLSSCHIIRSTVAVIALCKEIILYINITIFVFIFYQVSADTCKRSFPVLRFCISS